MRPVSGFYIPNLGQNFLKRRVRQCFCEKKMASWVDRTHSIRTKLFNIFSNTDIHTKFPFILLVFVLQYILVIAVNRKRITFIYHIWREIIFCGISWRFSYFESRNEISSYIGTLILGTFLQIAPMSLTFFNNS